MRWNWTRFGWGICAALILGASGCNSHQPKIPTAADLAGEYQGKVQLAPGQPELPIALSLRRDGRFVGDFPDPHLNWGGHMRAMGSWRVAGIDQARTCLLIELSANGRRVRAHCASREADGSIGINCSEGQARRQCDMKKTRPADA